MKMTLRRYTQSSSIPSRPGQVGVTELATTGAPVSNANAAPPTTGQVLTATSLTTSAWRNLTGGGGAQKNIIYVGKHGNANNGGRSEEQAVPTFSVALTLAVSRLPTETPIAIVCLDAGTYTEDIVVPTGIWIYAPNATINGSVALAGGNGIDIDSVFTNTPGASYSICHDNSNDEDAFVRFRYMELGPDVGGQYTPCAGLVNMQTEGKLIVEGMKIRPMSTNGYCGAVGGPDNLGVILGRIDKIALLDNTYGIWAAGKGHIRLDVGHFTKPHAGTYAVCFESKSCEVSLRSHRIECAYAYQLIDDCILYLECPVVNGLKVTAPGAIVIGQERALCNSDSFDERNSAELTYTDLGITKIGDPVNRLVRVIRVVVTPAFNGTSPVLIVGDTEVVGRFIQAEDVDLTVEGETVLYPAYCYDTAVQMLAALYYDSDGDAPTIGSVILYFG